jgi:hypothetical protein
MVFAALLALAGSGAAAQGAGWDQAGRGLELRAHARLMDLAQQQPAPFETDGCSGGLSAAWRMASRSLPAFARAHEDQPPFEPCCIAHDRQYHGAAGAQTAADSYAARLDADQDLRACVLETGAQRKADLAELYGVSEEQAEAAYAALARAVYYAVRFGGGPCSGLSWRWGYGFAHCRSGD